MSSDPIVTGLVFAQLSLALLRAFERLASGDPVTQEELDSLKEQRKAAVSDFEAAAKEQIGD